MKKVIIIAFAVLLSSSVFAKRKKKVEEPVAPVLVLADAADSVSYALGVEMGDKMRTMLTQMPGGEYNVDIFALSFHQSLRADSSVLMSVEVANAYLKSYMTAIKNEELKETKTEATAFLTENKKREGVIETASGLQYQVVRMGEGAKPVSSDKVKVHYEGFLLDGTPFDSSVKRGTPAEFVLSQVIKGWTEGLQLMPVGSKFTFYIPSDLGYGEQGAGSVIPPYATLIFEVELLDIIK